MTNSWVGDPSKYAEMSKPFETREEAERVAKEFFNAVQRIREQYRIAEVTMQAQVYIGDLEKPEKQQKLVFGGGWGNQLEQAKLAKRSADTELNHLLVMIRALTDAVPESDGTDLATDMILLAVEQLLAACLEARRTLITDPQW